MKRGFTLIELMISVAIFSIVMVMALGALLSISTSDRKAETIASVINNLNFAVESMTRTIRTGYDYHCGAIAYVGDCGTQVGTYPNGATLFKFTGADGNATVYRFDTSSVCNQSGATVGCISRSTDGGNTFLPITAPEVVITNLTFYLRGSALGSTGDTMQPNVVVSIVGYTQTNASSTVATGAQKTPFYLQTSATQRLYDR